MAISTNSIIHYTESFDILCSILSEGFKIKYCAERIRLGNGNSQAAHPMISFCDIPLSNSMQHFAAYGDYGIGLSKDWAIRMGVNPVLYIDKDSLFAISLNELIEDRRKTKSNLTKNQKENILKIKSYAKNYTGHLKRRGIDNPTYKFYDEREWRLVPKEEDMNSASFSISLSSYNAEKDKYNDKISDCRFKFNSTDVSYIIVKQTEEIPNMINFLREKYSDRCTAKELDILFSKICSTKQIIADY